MPQDAFNLRRNAEELNGLLSGGKINKVVQPARDEVLLYIYTGKSLLKLTICTNASFCRVCLTEEEKDAPAVAPNFCMLLRKHLLGAQITKVEQVGFERIVAVTMHCVSDFAQTDRVLYCEIMGKYSNIVLAEKGIILGALKTACLETGAARVLFPGAKYALPAPQDKADPRDRAALSGAVQAVLSSDDPAKVLCDRVAGIAYPTAAQIVAEYPLNAGMPFADFVYNYLFAGEGAPCVLYRGNEPQEFAAKRLTGALPAPSLQAAQATVYGYKTGKKAFEEKKRKLQNAATALKKKQEKKLAQILEKLKECEDAESCRLKGELITANIYRLERGMSACKLENYYEEGSPLLTVALDRTLTPAQNAQNYYKRYAKLKRTVEALTPRLHAEESDLDYTESVLAAIRQSEETRDLTEIEEELISLHLLREPQSAKKRKAAESPFRVFEKDGFIVRAGRNNVQNDRLVRAAAPDDVWLHTQKYHSAHVVIAAGGRKVPDAVLEFAARLCAYYSDGRGGGKIPVDYCERRFVKKPSGAKAGFVNYTNYKTVLVEPLSAPPLPQTKGD